MPVVVEVRVDVDLSAPCVEALGPLLELALRVVAVPAAVAVVKADECPRCGQLMRLERPLRVVADDERRPMLAQELVDLRREPALVPELEAVPPRAERLERRPQTVVVAVEVRGELPENRPHLRRASERLDPFVEALDPGPRSVSRLMCVS
jgi:hypothetical protein